MVSAGPPPLWEGDSGSLMGEGRERCYHPTDEDTNEKKKGEKNVWQMNVANFGEGKRKI